MSARITEPAAPVTRSRFAQKRRLLGVALDELNGRAFMLRHCTGQHHTGKAAARLPKSSQWSRRRREIQKLERIGDVPGPELRKRGGRDEIGLGLPRHQQIDIAIEPRLCFT